MATISQDQKYVSYVDTGGTFTDAVIIDRGGSLFKGKALTTPQDLSISYFNALEVASQIMGKTLDEVFKDTLLAGFGTTAGTNQILTRKGAPKIGFITTKGFEDIIYVQRGIGRVIGLDPFQQMWFAGCDKPEPLVPRKLIKGVTERVDSRGKVIFALYEKEAKEAIEELLSEGVEGIAVGFLWSFLNNKHEKIVGDLILKNRPNMPISLSCDIAPVMREYARFNSAIMNLYVGKAVREICQVISERLEARGYEKPLMIMQASGGVSRHEVVTPLHTLQSGPVGGLVGVNFWKWKYGFDHAAGSDVGGTSFDICLSPQKGPNQLDEPIVSRLILSCPMLETVSIGAGGGTIAKMDPMVERMVLGPESAGAVPGPVCYDRGGTEPTVTDADVILNRIDPDYFLGGKVRLNKEKAIEVMKERIADPMGVDVVEAAYGICKMIDMRMRDALRTEMRIKGYDPGDFALFVYGGAGALHCIGYSQDMNFKEIIIPPYASVFSAFGASTADVVHRYERTISLIFPPLPYDLGTQRIKISSLDEVPAELIKKYNNNWEALINALIKDMADEGFEREQIQMKFYIHARYGRQLYEIEVPTTMSRIEKVEDLRQVTKDFEDLYEAMYSTVTMVPGNGWEIMKIALMGNCVSPAKPEIRGWKYVGADASSALKGKRKVYFEGGFVESSIYSMEALQNGNIIKGPAIIEGVDTNVVIPPNYRVEVDKYLNMFLKSV